MAQAIENLPDDPNELKAMLLAERARNERLVQIIKESKHPAWAAGDDLALRQTVQAFVFSPSASSTRISAGRQRGATRFV
ncbi:hypothetical protein [Methylocystis echinoides]|uniref:hypothetical protein n=1 Tax=Methylocystis echinoides TaxID=29468 RepID=UPI0034139D8D